MKPLKVAIVGAGNVARNSYAPYLSKLPDIELSYFSRTRAKAEGLANDFGGSVAGSVAELLEGAPDTILVLTHETQRAEATRALLAGKPKRLFFEKPLIAQGGQAHVCESDFFEAHSLLKEAARMGTETAMVFNYRFFVQTQRALEIVGERSFGSLTQASLLVNYACWSHCIDLLHCFGGTASRVTAQVGTSQFQGAVDLAGTFQLARGATGTILGTSGGKFDYPLYEMHFHFEHGSLHFSDLDGPLVVDDFRRRYRESHTLIDNHSRWDQYHLSFQTALAAYLDAVRSDAPPPVLGIAGLEELQFEVSLRRSAEQNRPVDVAQEFPLAL